MKKTLSFILVAFMLLTLLAGCGGNKNNDTDTNNGGDETNAPSYEFTFRDLPNPVYIDPAESFAGGTGTESDPFKISNAAELALMEKLLNDPDKSFSNPYDAGYFVLTNDIVINDVSNFDSWKTTAPQYSWKPIGNLHFKGVFDGAGHTVSGMYINVNNGTPEKSESGYYGLFGKINGTIKNLTVEKSYLAVSGSRSYVGGIVGDVFTEGKIIDCVSRVTIDTYDSACGGIVGNTSGGIVIGVEETKNNPKYAEITNCVFEGEINQIKKDSLTFAAGIVGVQIRVRSTSAQTTSIAQAVSLHTALTELYRAVRTRAISTAL